MLGPVLAFVVAAATTTSLIPKATIPLPATIGQWSDDVTWENPQSVLITSDKGVMRYSLRTKTTQQVISTLPLPEGLPDPEAVSSDGVSVAATSHFTIGGYNHRLADGHRLMASRVFLMPIDVAVRGQRSCIFAWDMKNKDGSEAVWCGAVNRPWNEYKPVHRVNAESLELRSVNERWGGAIAMGADGSVTVVTSLEPGVFRYAPDGKLIEVLGRAFEELVFHDIRTYRNRFGTDVYGRYRLALNSQPIIDDMVLTPRGPALVVRTANEQHTHWALWWPRASGQKAIPPTPLGIDRIGPFGHLHCDTRGNQMACVGSFPSKKIAANIELSEKVPYLWIFELPQ